MKPHQVHTSECPRCFERFDMATGVEHECRPSPGDMTVCSKCLALLVFEEKEQLREITEEEESQLDAEDIRTIEIARSRAPSFHRERDPNQPQR
jgi:hypothetical protein